MCVALQAQTSFKLHWELFPCAETVVDAYAIVYVQRFALEDCVGGKFRLEVVVASVFTTTARVTIHLVLVYSNIV